MIGQSTCSNYYAGGEPSSRRNTPHKKENGCQPSEHKGEAESKVRTGPFGLTMGMTRETIKAAGFDLNPRAVSDDGYRILVNTLHPPVKDEGYPVLMLDFTDVHGLFSIQAWTSRYHFAATPTMTMRENIQGALDRRMVVWAARSDGFANIQDIRIKAKIEERTRRGVILQFELTVEFANYDAAMEYIKMKGMQQMQRGY